ncbi:stAR-related lipid transfer protein 8 isoform a [Cricetulus griseus]|uniref:StAR-related lipid transfer protein 8 isoform a n=1 Tax=Cricetulus griseus TaxID=10029 RepID=A0A061HXG3_CRIGR|nr:stAR-related lipid transfer protein 8 isoform a [Cricetulus griseus]
MGNYSLAGGEVYLDPELSTFLQVNSGHNENTKDRGFRPSRVLLSPSSFWCPIMPLLDVFWACFKKVKCFPLLPARKNAVARNYIQSY